MNATGPGPAPGELTPLWAAAEKFASRKLRTKLADSLRGLPAGIEMQILSQSRWEKQDALVERLRQGKLEAWGVQSSPERKQLLERVPAHYFLNAKIDWNRHSVTNFGVMYVAVGVRRPNLRRDAMTDHPPPSLPTPSKGRPSKSAEINQVIDLLLNEGVDLHGMLRPAAFAKIKRAATKLNLNVKVGYSVPILQRELYRRFGPRR